MTAADRAAETPDWRASGHAHCPSACQPDREVQVATSILEKITLSTAGRWSPAQVQERLLKSHSVEEAFGQFGI